MFKVYAKSGKWGEYDTIGEAESIANSLSNKSWNDDEIHITDESGTILKRVPKGQ